MSTKEGYTFPRIPGAITLALKKGQSRNSCVASYYYGENLSNFNKVHELRIIYISRKNGMIYI